MAKVDEFVKIWAPREEKPSLVQRIKNKVTTPQPVRYKLAVALYKIRVQSNKLDYIINKMKERDAQLFEKVVQAQMEKDQTRAAMYAAEVAEIRKIVKALMTTKLALERVGLRLETVMTMGDVLTNLAPVVAVIGDLKKYLMGLAPEIGLELAEIGELLESVVSETTEFTGYMSVGTPTIYSEEARKILEEAAAIAEQRLRTEFPELPSIPSTTGNQQSSGSGNSNH